MPFDTSNGSYVKDYTTYNNLGINYSLVQGYVAGIKGKALNFTGTFSNSQELGVNVNRTSALEPQRLTIEAWVYIIDDADHQDLVLTKRYSRLGAPYNSYAMDRVNNYYRFCLGPASGSQVCLPSGDYVSLSNWQHVAATFDGTTMKIYVNGTLKNSSTDFSGQTIVYNSSENV